MVVRPEFQNRGIGKSTVSAVTLYALDKSIVPCYSTIEANTASRTPAAALSYKTAWIERYVSTYCKDIKA